MAYTIISWRATIVMWSIVDTETTGLNDDDYVVSLGTLIADVNPDKGAIECVDSMYSLIRSPDPSMAEKRGISTAFHPKK